MSQGTIKTFDPITNTGLILDDGGDVVPLSSDALDQSIFRMLRQGQRVNYDRETINGMDIASRIRLGQGGS